MSACKPAYACGVHVNYMQLHEPTCIACAGVRVIITMLPACKHVREAYCGEEGILSANGALHACKSRLLWCETLQEEGDLSKQAPYSPGLLCSIKLESRCVGSCPQQPFTSCLT